MRGARNLATFKALEGINKTIYEEVISSSKKYYYDPSINETKLREFLSLSYNDYERRQKLAIDISRGILAYHEKRDLPNIAFKLACLERDLTEIQPYQRDHICHSLFTFLIGYYLIKNFNLEEDDFLFEWRLAALLHDVGYVLEITDRLNENYLKQYEKDLLMGESVEFKPQGGHFLSQLVNLYTKNPRGKRDTINLINKRFRKWSLSINGKKVFNEMIKGEKFDDGPRRTDHGVTSAILVMKAIDKKYEIHNPEQKCDQYDPWNFKNLENQIANSCAAIFLHNLKYDSFLWDFNKFPLATLLKLCDELQDWTRSSGSELNPTSPKDYDIKIENGQLIFKVIKEKVKIFQEKIENIINFPVVIKPIS